MRSFLITAGLLLHFLVQGQPLPKESDLSSVLNPDGTLNQHALRDQSFNATGYRMSCNPDGSPVFQRVAVPGDENWSPEFAIQGTNGLINTVWLDSNDLYVGGIFTTAGGNSAMNVAHWNGNIWSPMGAGIGGTTDQVTDIKKFGNYVYATSTAGVFRWDGSSWTQIGVLSQILNAAIAAAGLDLDASGNLYVTGDFVRINGVTVNGIAKWNGSNWSALGTGIDNPGGGSGNVVLVQGSNLYLGGGFTRVGGVLATNIAIWNGSNWNRLGTGITTTGSVTALALQGNNLIVAAPGMTAAGSVPVNNIAQWDGSNWSAMGAGLNNAPLAISVWGNDLYVGGTMTQSGSIPVNKVAKWNGTAWSDAGNGLLMLSGVLSLAINSQYFFAGGSSWLGDPFNVNHIARWNGTRWVNVGNGKDNYINCVTVSGNYVYVGGKFTTSGGLRTNGIARWDGQAWDSLGHGFPSGEVFDIEVVGNLVYAGGSISWGGPSGPSYLGVWNGSTWSALGTGVNSTVFTLQSRGTDLYVGGTFSTAGGITVNNIAKWNGSVWSALGFGSNSIVKDIKFTSDGTMYAGGNFTTIGSVAANRIAKWNGTTWSAVGSGVNSFVNVIGISSTDEIYIGGAFDLAVNGGLVNHLAKWNGSAWVGVGGGLPTPTGNVYSIVFRGNDMYVGGVFTQAGTISANNIAKWDGTNWSALGAGTSGSPGQSVVLSLASNCNSLFVGGFFTQAGDKRSDRFGRYWLDGLPAVTISTPNTSVCTGTTVNFTANPVNGGTSPSYQWKLNGANVGTNSPTYSSNSLPNNARVQVIMSGNAGCIHPVNAASNVISMTVQTPLTPSVTINTPFTTICAGTNGAFIANAQNAGSNPVYQWQVNGSNVGTNSNIFASTTLPNNAQVRVIITTGAGCFTTTTATSNVISMTVLPVVIPAISISGNSTVIQGGASLISSSIQNGGSTPAYSWSDSTNAHNWQVIPGAINSTLNYTPAATGDKLRATLTTNATCPSTFTVTSNEIQFTVTPVTAVGNVSASRLEIRYFPNPAHHELVIDSLKPAHRWMTVSVYTTEGMKVRADESIGNRTRLRLDIAGLPSGAYIVVLRRKDGTEAYLKFIRQ